MFVDEYLERRRLAPDFIAVPGQKDVYAGITWSHLVCICHKLIKMREAGSGMVKLELEGCRDFEKTLEN